MYNPTEKFDTLKPAKSPKRFLKSKILQGLGATSGGWAPFPTNTERNIERKILLQAPGTLAPASGGGGGTPATGLLNGLIGYWKMDEASNVSRADATGNGWTATQANGNIPAAAGLINNATDLTNGGARTTNGLYIPIAIDTRAQTSPFSMMVWLNPNVTGVGFCYGFSQYPSTGGTQGWYVYTTNQDFRWQGYNLAGASQFNLTPAPAANFTLNAWNQCIITYDGTTAKLYQNGVGGTGSASAAASGIGRGLFRVTIGNSDGVNAGQPGLYDECAYWTRALSGAEIAMLYNGGAGLPFSSF